MRLSKDELHTLAVTMHMNARSDEAEALAKKLATELLRRDPQEYQSSRKRGAVYPLE